MKKCECGNKLWAKGMCYNCYTKQWLQKNAAKISISVGSFSQSIYIRKEFKEKLMKFKNEEKERIFNDCIKSPQKYL